MQVTAIRPDARQPGYLVIDVDRARYASLPLERVRALGVVEGMVLEGELARRLERAVAEEAAFQVATRLIRLKPRSVYEMLAKLEERGHAPPAAAAAVGRLEQAGLLSDEHYARHYVRVRAARGHGPSRLLHDLLGKGIERRLAERAIAEVLEVEGVDPAAQAESVARKRLAQMGDLPPEQRRRRLLAYLARRGFRGREVQEMVRRLLAGAEGS